MPPKAAAPSEDPPASPEKPKKRRLDVDTSLILNPEGRSKRRRSPTPPPPQADPDPKDPARAKALGLVLYNRIMGMRDGEESMAEPYIKLPNKRQFPDYYETIKHPMSLEMVREKLEASQYDTLRDVCNDFGQIWNNAKRYNVRESTLFQWAKKLHKLTRTYYSQHSAGHAESESEGEDAPQAPTAGPSRAVTADAEAEDSDGTGAGSTPAATDGAPTPRASGPGTGRKRGSYMKDGPTVYKLIKPCMRAIQSAKADDGSGRDIADIFISLPDRRDFPDYYRQIKHPISLEEIEHKMATRRYGSADHFFEDVEKMCENAMAYNEDESEVWRDARQILGIVRTHRQLVKDRLAGPRYPSLPKSRPSMVTPVRQGLPAPAGYVQQSHGYAPAPAASSAPYLPQLPPGVVTEEVVASLERYPALEQQAWAASLPPLAQSIYRQMVATAEAKKRGLPPPQSLATPPTPSSKTSELKGPVVPSIKHIDFAYANTPTPSRAATPPIEAVLPLGEAKPHNPLKGNAIRLSNIAGVLSHAVSINSSTAVLELTAWVTDATGANVENVPEVLLRINGGATSKPHLIQAEAPDRPTGMRWTVPLPPARNDSKIEVVATKPGARAETSAIFVNRQF